MTNELTPKFNPTEVEAGRYEKWLEADVFKHLRSTKAHYIICLSLGF